MGGFHPLEEDTERYMAELEARRTRAPDKKEGRSIIGFTDAEKVVETLN